MDGLAKVCTEYGIVNCVISHRRWDGLDLNHIKPTHLSASSDLSLTYYSYIVLYNEINLD